MTEANQSQVTKEHFIKANLYETQALLYMILGELQLHLGTWKWIGWICLTYGFFTFFSAFFVALIGEVKEGLEKKLKEAKE